MQYVDNPINRKPATASYCQFNLKKTDTFSPDKKKILQQTGVFVNWFVNFSY